MISIQDKDNSSILDNSICIRWWVGIYTSCKEKTISFIRTSAAGNLIEKLKKQLYLAPVKTVSIILTFLFLLNAFFSLILNQEIALFNWILKIFFLSIAASGLFCHADWKTIKEGSYILTCLFSKKKGLA